MARILIVLAALGAAVAVAAAVWPAGSQAAPATPTQRTFVSTSGSDANPCSSAKPCRTFAAALPNTLAGGEVVALDSGGYGPFTVNKAVTVAGAPGAHVAVTAFSGDAITVDAPGTDTVVLRNLYLTGIGAAEFGIAFHGGGTLIVESVVVGGFGDAALDASADAATLIVSGSRFRNSLDGVVVSGSLHVEIEDTRADQNSRIGFWFLSGARGSVDGSHATGNALNGFAVQSGAFVAISDSVADGNLRGISVLNTGSVAEVTQTAITNNPGAGLFTAGSPAPVARIGGSTVTGNGVGLEESSGSIETYADNLVRGNTTDVSGTLTVIGKT